MPSTKPTPASKPAKTPSLKQRAARARDGLLCLAPRPALPSPLPEPGSPEAKAAFGAACRAFDRATYLSDEQYAVLHIGNSGTLWTPERVREAMRGDFSWFNPREMEGARAKTCEELEDLLVLTLRRDLRFAEAERRSGVRAMFALAHPEAEQDEPEPTLFGDQALAMIVAHRAAYAAWLPHLDAVTEKVTGTTEFDAAEERAEPARVEEGTAFGNVISVRPTTVSGLRALAGYLPDAVRLNACSEPDDDAVLALRTMCNGVLALVVDEAPVAGGPVRRSFPPENTIAAGLGFKAMSLTELASTHDGAVLVKDVARAIACQPRSLTNAPFPAPDLNALGLLMEWIGTALGFVADEALDEMRRRVPANAYERDRRLQVLAEATVSNGDPDETRVFTRELLEAVET